MQNFSQNSIQSFQHTRPQVTSIQQLQNYISQLTIYINQNNQKYNKNMQTLKNFYTQQVQWMQMDKQHLQKDVLHIKNQLVTVKDLYLNRNKQLQDGQEEIKRWQRYNNEGMLKIDSVYQQMEQVRDKDKMEVDHYLALTMGLQQKNNHLLVSLQQPSSQISNYQQQVISLQDKVSERYSLPEKVHEKEINQVKSTIQLQHLFRKNRDLNQDIDYQHVQIQKEKKENQHLRILKGKASAQMNLKVKKTIRKQKETSEGQIKKLWLQNQNSVYQINSLQISVKSLRQQLNDLQTQFKRQKVRASKLGKDISNVTIEKDAYLSQSCKLKQYYEGVIQRLETSLIEYEKKNWAMQQSNKDHNYQLDGLQELFRQLRAINQVQPAIHEYIKWAELQVLARQDRKKVAEQHNSKLKQPSDKHLSQSQEAGL